MGAWGAKSFQNDHARDWLSAVRDSPDWEIIDGALQKAGTCRSGDEAKAVAAAEIVAAAASRPSPFLPDEALALAMKLGPPSHELFARARASSERILGQSELRELWDDDPDWLGEMQSLVSRLS